MFVCVVSDESYRDDFRSKTCCKVGEEVEDSAWWLSGIIAWLSVLRAWWPSVLLAWWLSGIIAWLSVLLAWWPNVLLAWWLSGIIAWLSVLLAWWLSAMRYHRVAECSACLVAISDEVSSRGRVFCLLGGYQVSSRGRVFCLLGGYQVSSRGRVFCLLGGYQVSSRG